MIRNIGHVRTRFVLKRFTFAYAYRPKVLTIEMVKEKIEEMKLEEKKMEADDPKPIEDPIEDPTQDPKSTEEPKETSEPNVVETLSKEGIIADTFFEHYLNFIRDVRNVAVTAEKYDDKGSIVHEPGAPIFRCTEHESVASNTDPVTEPLLTDSAKESSAPDTNTLVAEPEKVPEPQGEELEMQKFDGEGEDLKTTAV